VGGWVDGFRGGEGALPRRAQGASWRPPRPLAPEARRPGRLRSPPLPPNPPPTPQVKRDTIFRLEGGSEETVSGRLALWRELTGPVAAVDSLRGYLVVAVGPRVEMHYKQVREWW
jgi:hypothetical protein